MAKKNKSKRNLNNEKLILEINKLNDPWYKKLEFWKILIPTIAVISSLYFAFGKSVIDAQKEKLAVQKEILKLEILQFKIKKGTVIEDIENIQKKLTKKERSLDSLNIRNTNLTDKNNLLKKTILLSKREINKTLNKKEKEVKSILREQSLDKNFYTKKIFEQYELAKQRAKNINNYKNKISTLKADLKKMEVENQFYSKKINLSHSDSSKLFLLKQKVSLENIIIRNKEIDDELKRIEDKYKNASKKINTISSEDSYREIKLWLLEKEYE